MSYRAAVVGASGYSGAELLRLLAAHPSIEVAAATSREFAGKDIAGVYPNLSAYAGRTFSSLEDAGLDQADIVFLALPHGASMSVGAPLADAGARIVDFSADFRLTDAALYAAWYGADHAAPEWLGKWAYGLPEMHRDQIKGAALVANPGCYPTAAALALAPLLAEGLIEPSGITIAAASGVSGAGRGMSAGVHFSHVDASVKAYGFGKHKHTPEIEQELSLAAGAPVTVTFVPHLVPTARGLLATCTARLVDGAGGARVRDAVVARYDGEPFVRATPAPPETKFVSGSNGAHVYATADERTGTAIAVCAIDNLGKGAAGQALQNANLMLGLDETAGLTAGGIYP
ncbi:MAG TPA: N-acetyl-gamma-glutamyl-phosphate reductase [Actinomycetota bacterium]|nr:N-acetyl-gamma-glutamyl-phosphate reductase [Actinomycetota bacterium]